MRWYQQLVARVSASRARARLEREMAEEMEFHLEESARQYQRQGYDAQAALRAARLRFGSLERFKEEAREQERARWLEQLLEDLRYALRTFTRQKIWALGIVLVLALGVGANTAVFSLVDAVLFRAPDALRAEELVRIYSRFESGELSGSSYPAFAELRGATRQLSSVSASYTDLTFNVAGAGGLAERVPGAVVSGNYFALLGTQPARGRLFSAADDRVKGAHAVAIVSHEYWRSKLGGRSDVQGLVLRINNVPFTVVGVAPRGFRSESFDRRPAIWVPLMMAEIAAPGLARLAPLDRRGFTWLEVTGRLAAGSSAASARAELNAIAGATNHPGDPVASLEVLPASAATIALEDQAEARRLSWILLGVVALVLLLACADVAALLLARAEQRRRELAVRLTLGATHGRLLRQLVAENLLLAGAGALGGLGIALLLRRAVPALAPANFPIPLDSATSITEGRVLLLTALTAVFCALLFGVAPSLMATRIPLQTVLRGPLAGLRAARLRLPLRDALVAAQLALSLVFLTGGALLARSIRNVTQLDPGFARAGVIAGTIDLSRNGYDRARSETFYRLLLERLRATPGVRHAALAYHPMIRNHGIATSTAFEGHVYANDDAMPSTDVNIITEEYLSAAGIPLLRGRGFTQSDVESGKPVALVSKALADRYWPGQEAIGKHIGAINDPPVEVVGIVADAKYRTLRERPRPLVYVPLWQMDITPMSIVLRSDLDAAAARTLLARTVAEFDANVPVYDLVTVQQRLAEAFAQERLLAVLLGGFALLGLILAATGVFALVSFNVRSRMREWGIRIAIGARPRTLLRHVQAGAARIAALGLALGLLSALLLSRYLQSLLFGVTATDALSYVAACVLLLSAALLASYLPARAATRTDALRALRSE